MDQKKVKIIVISLAVLIVVFAVAIFAYWLSKNSAADLNSSSQNEALPQTKETVYKETNLSAVMSDPLSFDNQTYRIPGTIILFEEEYYLSGGGTKILFSTEAGESEVLAGYLGKSVEVIATISADSTPVLYLGSGQSVKPLISN